MKRPWIALIGITACIATTPRPFYVQCALVDRIADAAKAGPSEAKLVVLEILERVAEGRMDTANPDLETPFGLRPGQLRGPEFKEKTVRAEALQKIAELDVPEALAFLQNLTGPDFATHSGQLWPDAQVALHRALLKRIPDEASQVRFLEDTARTSVAYLWAVDELCDRGSQGSLPVVRASIRRHDSTRRGEQRIAFCEARMDIVSRNPDRIAALGSFLNARAVPAESQVSPENRLVPWAILQLRSMKSPRAHAELERFADEIDDLPEGSPQKEALWGYRVTIRGAAPQRKRG